jgi:hypothetical protein
VEEFPLLERLVKKHGSRGFAVVSINVEPADDGSARELMRLHGYPFTALTVPDAAWKDRHGVRSTPFNLLLDRAGRIVLEPTFASRDVRAIAEHEIVALIARRP